MRVKKYFPAFGGHGQKYQSRIEEREKRIDLPKLALTF